MPSRDNEMLSITRRHFLELTGSGALLATFTGGALLTLNYLYPNVLFEPSTVFIAGRPDDYAMNSVTQLTAQKTLILRTKRGFQALSAVCTHLGCITRWVEDQGVIACPCHGSKFRVDGDVIDGPAPKPLPQLMISLNDNGELLVNKNIVVEKDRYLEA